MPEVTIDFGDWQEATPFFPHECACGATATGPDNYCPNCDNCSDCCHCNEQPEPESGRRECPDCGYGFDQFSDERGCRSCGRCSDCCICGRPGEHEDGVMSALNRIRLKLMNRDDRPVRLQSFEQEFGTRTASAAEALTAAGIRCYDSADEPAAQFCSWHGDGSCDGEIVWDRLLLDKTIDERAFRRGQTILETGRRGGAGWQTNTSCGLHIHVDTQGYSMGNCESLYHAYNYLEDVLYGIGSSGWDQHRIAEGNDYARLTPKGLAGGKSLGNSIHRTRYYGLNLTPYLGAITRCQCGAYRFAEWAACDCNIPKPTVEFRVFNATTNARKLLAYSALTQALVAAAQAHTFTPKRYPPFPHMVGNDMGAEVHRVQEDRLQRYRFILTRLPLEQVEREAIAYCATHNYQMRGNEAAIEQILSCLEEPVNTVNVRELPEPLCRQRWLSRSLAPRTDTTN